MLRNIEFICPNCHSHLHRVKAHFVCDKCFTKWPINEDIPNFCTHYKESKSLYLMDKENQNELLNIAKKEGWQSALKKIYASSCDFLYDYAYGEGRLDWHYLLPISTDTKVLDIGCGWGSISLSLSNLCKFVVSADVVDVTLKFLNIRKEQERITNVQPVKIDPLDYGKLPFPDSYFDLSILIGVLEWVGTQKMNKSPRELQKSALKEIRRVLKPDGVLYIGIENRYAISYFFGNPDHSGLPFASVLPKRLANFYSRIVKKEPYRTYIYSYKGYKQLLSEAGYSDVEIYLLAPSYQFPLYIVPLNKRPFYYYTNYIQHQTNLFKLLVKKAFFALGAENAFCHDFGIIAKVTK
ncbi:class I SAM-dependent methyltransferase [candidate division WOR-3 bacterium]|nr:class I SAM-dependent methyltransferase [candidate division WOR-3 bacterium]